MMEYSNFKKVENEHECDPFDPMRERHIRTVSPTCFISVLFRMTGFGYREWETAIRMKRGETWDCNIIAGDRREELNDIVEDEIMDWYERNIDGNRNSLETLIENLEKSTEQSKDSVK